MSDTINDRLLKRFFILYLRRSHGVTQCVSIVSDTLSTAMMNC